MGELACTFATLILHDEGQAVNSNSIAKLLKAAKVDVEPYWPTLFANALSDANIGDMLMSSGGSGAPAPVAATGGETKQEAKVEEAPEEPEEEDVDLGDLFG